jgi:hypothetical protein
MARTQLHAPTSDNKAGTPKLLGLTVSPQSQLAAADLVKMIKGSKRLPSFISMLFVSKGNRIMVLEGTVEFPTGVTGFPAWFLDAHEAINSGLWHMTTGTANVDALSMLSMSDRIRGDYESGDAPFGGARSDGITVGETVSNFNAASFMGLRKVADEQAGGGPGSPLRRPMAGSVPGEGLVVIGNRFKDLRTTIGPEVPRAPDAILETFFHELGAHAFLEQNGKNSEHSPGNRYLTAPITDADITAAAVHTFFGNPDEEPLIEQARVSGWDRVRGQSAPSNDTQPPPASPSSQTPNIWDRAKTGQ